MKSIFLRSVCIALVTVLLVQDTQAQRRHNNNRGRNGYSYNYRRPYYGQRVSNFYGPRMVIPYRGIQFRYSSGYYYRPYNNYFRVVAPPIGIHINVLPPGYRRIYAGSNPYYYYGGAYYRENNKQYEVVDAPLGASVPELPEGAKVVVINDQKYYELAGTYYKEEIRDNSEIWYTVVGKNGELNTDNELTQEDNGPQTGDVLDELPEGCKTVVINGQKLYVSPDDIYYEEIVENQTVKYRVAGK